MRLAIWHMSRSAMYVRRFLGPLWRGRGMILSFNRKIRYLYIGCKQALNMWLGTPYSRYLNAGVGANAYKDGQSNGTSAAGLEGAGKYPRLSTDHYASRPKYGDLVKT